MQTLTEVVLEKIPQGVFTFSEAACLVGHQGGRVYGLVKRAIAAGEVVHLRRELYCLAPRLWRHEVSPLALAQTMYGPSYVSLESALSWHGWIPEAVRSVFSVCDKRSRTFDTALGVFSFVRVPQRTLMVAVQRLEQQGSGAVFMAEPVKALADYVYHHRCNWTSLEGPVESLRIEPQELAGVRRADVDVLLANYDSPRVRRFLEGLKRNLRKRRS